MNKFFSFMNWICTWRFLMWLNIALVVLCFASMMIDFDVFFVPGILLGTLFATVSWMMILFHKL